MLRRIGELLLGRVLYGFVALSLLLLLMYAFRFPLMRGLGNHLITEDPVERTDAIYVLGGSPLDRGAAGARLLMDAMAPVLVCTGLNIPSALQVEGIQLTEAELSRNVALRSGADPSRVELLLMGTSTWEESEGIMAHALEQGHRSITVVSTEFHLRRIGRVFRKRFADAGIKVHLHGATSAYYDSARWWESEEGLLMVNNEYVKLIYYCIKY